MVGSDDRQLWARQVVGARLRQLRRRRNLRQEVAAETLKASISKISRMESGHVPYRRQDLLDLLTLYRVSDPFQQEALISVALGHREPGWWDDHDVPLRETVLWSLEQVADLVRIYQPHLVPDLLQTEEYARTAHRTRHVSSPSEAATEASAANVMRRQQLLRGRGTRVWAVIDEPALWRPVGGNLDAHLRQLDALADASQRRDVTIQIVAMDSPYLPAAEPFTIFRVPGKGQTLAVHRFAGDEVTDLSANENYGLLFDQLVGVARRGADTPHILAGVRDRLSPSGGRL